LDFEKPCPYLNGEVEMTQAKAVYPLDIVEDGADHSGIGSYLPFLPQLFVNDGKAIVNRRDDHANGGDDAGGNDRQQKTGVTGHEQVEDIQTRFH
jgi:hypothetical protein